MYNSVIMNDYKLELEKNGVKIDTDFTRDDFVNKVVDFYKNNR